MAYEKFDNIDWVTPDVKEFAYYWRSLDRDRVIPRRQSFDPGRISPLLHGIAIYEVRSRDEILYRLAGTKLVDRIGMEVTGKNFLDFFEGERRAKAADAMYECVSRPCGMFSRLTGVSYKGRVETSVAAGFPLLDQDDTCNRLVFYSSGFDEDSFRVPEEDRIKSLEAEQTIFIQLDN
ncbi:PAS domain-containing protein [Sneathiella sp. HT1-7]|uniref:PAS domain-containing protein n=1 Tax=Sneathiella sp. HT1-7 TaxID=2887192 RepID=UPI001D1424B2|nr:PAS domain-containing protein [Sneathiella sp. HT1-7]MCC3304798.1 PAS domain-containing protein [Sneathiella sp. HT1-7]